MHFQTSLLATGLFFGWALSESPSIEIARKAVPSRLGGTEHKCWFKVTGVNGCTGDSGYFGESVNGKDDTVCDVWTTSKIPNLCGAANIRIDTDNKVTFENFADPAVSCRLDSLKPGSSCKPN